ncbi:MULTISPECIES: AI-2E family transporter [Pseudomonas]|uniref:Predicted PurR-regulated permease PerM n=2 Tax=Ectopseudomonas TaxID=3236654 RepID=A0A653AZ61_ECTOL|nr:MULTISPECIES: AI-2E family transporter [unclassified Pseudomonas]TNF17014.1 MAG: AI-2E family transporter [Pseudomonadales bacterium]CAE6940862.1 Putative permease often clustered with de novo purine synthesis [Pseudomonas oleovorans]QFT23099.1 pheromone autoinducer 2 transporter [Pseudomonas sp. THAF187a]QFT43286.1 pheromone autoinducer 2 transporter [Pseudomonas sp. THAF42]HIQ42736.1 AI-2E family transporter [Pseudomonas oleovorans]
MTDSTRWLWMAGLFLLGWLLYLLHPILSPFLIGILLAYLGDPLVDRLERQRLSRTGGVVVVFALFALVLLILLLVLVPMLGRQLVRLYQLAPEMLDWLQGTALPWTQSHLGLQDVLQLDQLKQVFTENIGKTTDVLKLVLAQATSSSLAFLAWLGNLLLIPVVSFYLMRDWDLLVERMRRLLPRQREGLVVKLTSECHEVLGAFLRGQLLVMLALSVIYASGLMLVGLELGLLIGLLAGLASIVPYMGFIVGIGAALTAALFQFGLDPYPLLGIGVVFMIGQMLEGMVLTPMLVGDRIGLHPVAVIFAILAGGQLFGFTGVLLALPVAAVIMVLLRHAHDLYKLSGLYGESNSGSDEPPSPA